ncbi:MAG TPA: hypothetical protein VGB54_11165 [Allosphingosinicella sp.]
MSTDPALRPSAAQRAPFRQGAGRRSTHSIAQLERLSDRLDLLIRDARAGAGSHREFERQVAEAEAIGAGVRAAFRGSTSPQPSNPPLWQQGGKAGW